MPSGQRKTTFFGTGPDGMETKVRQQQQSSGMRITPKRLALVAGDVTSPGYSPAAVTRP